MNRFLQGSVALHAASLAMIAARPRAWRWAAAAIGVDQALLAGAGMLPRSRLLGPNLNRLPPGTNHVALTFDDGPDPEVTPRVLDLLDEAGARASFFCIGARARRHPSMVREIARRGHGVENHTERHLYRFAALSPAALAREIAAAQDILASLSGRAPTWFRAPMGLRSPLLQSALEARGLHLASWTRRALDGVPGGALSALDGAPGGALSALDGAPGGARAALHRLTRRLAPGDVLLMHDGNCARDAEDRAVVLAVLPALLRRLERSGLAGVSLPRNDGQHVELDRRAT